MSALEPVRCLAAHDTRDSLGVMGGRLPVAPFGAAHLDVNGDGVGRSTRPMLFFEFDRVRPEAPAATAGVAGRADGTSKRLLRVGVGTWCVAGGAETVGRDTTRQDGDGNDGNAIQLAWSSWGCDLRQRQRATPGRNRDSAIAVTSPRVT